MTRRLLAAAALLAACACPPAVAVVTPGALPSWPEDLVDRFIVRLRDPVADVNPMLARIGAVFGERLAHVRPMSGELHVVRLGRRIGHAEAREVARLLRADARFAFVEPDWRVQALAVPNDTMYAQQWHFHEPAGGINLAPAWDVTTGSPALTVAIIDTGVLPHADLAARLLPGHDFVTDAGTGNDGDGRDADASDPGDYGCNGSASSWHGTHVAGTVGAATNNGAGVSGINWRSKLLPVRVLGRCGGYTSDIVDGMRWAAGLAVPGAPVNPTPARVLNLSLGGEVACSPAFQRAVDDVVARGAVVVAAAGNGSHDVSLTQPANCNGVIAVAATTRSGARAPYSNYGAKVALAAPGGSSTDGVLSTLNASPTTPGADSYATYQGTSMAAPHVSGVVSLMLSVAPSLTPAQVLERLRQTARPFPAGSDCTVATCGAGIVNAGASVAGLAAPAAPVAGTWTRIAGEGLSFTVSGTQTVRYGIGSSWVQRSVTSGGVCSNEFFGSDPAVGTAKQCEVLGSASMPAPSTGTWARIATEGQGFAVSGTQVVRYGTGASWVMRTVTHAGACSNAFFGTDPAVGVGKECDVGGALPTSWSWIASERQGFTVSGTRTVRYGAGSAWVTRSVTSGGVCSNEFFGTDPASGIGKQCEVATP